PHLEAALFAHRRGVPVEVAIPVLRVDVGRDAQPRDLALAAADVALERAVHELADVQVVHPDEHRRGIGEQLEALLALADLELGALERVDVHQQQDRTVDLVLEGAVGAHAQRIPAPVAVLHLTLTFWITSTMSSSRFGTSMLSLMSESGRPMSAWIMLRILSAGCVKRRMRRSGPSITIAMLTLASRLVRSLLICESS